MLFYQQMKNTFIPTMSLEEAIVWVKVIAEKYRDTPIPADEIPDEVRKNLIAYGLIDHFTN